MTELQQFKLNLEYFESLEKTFFKYTSNALEAVSESKGSNYLSLGYRIDIVRTISRYGMVAYN